MKRHICIHGHFYQPPRENPWLEEIEIQDSAYPYHDWNERISTECYAPNTASRILNAHRKISDIVNNYTKISFNFGPTLLSWMERNAPGVYRAIVVSDKISLERFGGHGAAMAQAYNHMIMPLANSRDKRTQVIWGIKDFEFRFGRKPEGMWLPETAVDVESLELFAEFGIKFTILAPHQAKRIRRIGEADWQDITEERVDPKMPYLCKLPSGNSISFFFYDGPVSRDVAFQGLLNNGETFAQRLLGAFPEASSEPLLENIATDGETYGHHHKLGDMALAYCCHYLDKQKLARVTIYGEFLEKNPPKWEAEIHENSAWSCAHGVERWRSDCGCNTGLNPGWKQKWREPLRRALDLLRDRMIPLYEKEMQNFAKAPWEARNAYIEVVLDRSPEQVEKFFKKHLRPNLTAEEKVRCLKLLELQRHAMLMYTSCGWFFDDISGLEATQVLQYAARCLQLTKEMFGVNLDGEFHKILKSAPSNVPELKDGAQIFDIYIRPKVLDLFRVGVHYAVSSIFENYPPEAEIFCYHAHRDSLEEHKKGEEKLIIGRARIRSQVTWEELPITFAVLYLGKHNLRGHISAVMEEKEFTEMRKQLKEDFVKNNMRILLEGAEKYFGAESYSLWHIFKSVQGKVLNQILEPALDEIRYLFRHIYEHHYPVMQAKQGLRISLPRTLATTVEFVLNRDLLELLDSDILDLELLKRLVEEVKRWSLELDNASLSFAATQKVGALMQQWAQSPENEEALMTAESVFKVLKVLQLNLDRWKAQNIYFSIGKDYLKTMQERSSQGNAKAAQWLAAFQSLGSYLEI